VREEVGNISHAPAILFTIGPNSDRNLKKIKKNLTKEKNGLFLQVNIYLH